MTTKLFKERNGKEATKKQSRKSQIRQLGYDYTALENNVETIYNFLRNRGFMLEDSYLAKEIDKVDRMLARAVQADVERLQLCRQECEDYANGKLGPTVKTEVSAARYDAKRIDQYLEKIEKIRAGK